MKPVSLAVGNRNLLKLATFLEKLPRARFDYDTFVGKDWKGKKDLSCGTTACAIGWATTIPAFRKAGLRLTAHGIVIGASHIDEAAGLDLFAITDFEWDYLFLPSNTLPDTFPGKVVPPQGPDGRATAKAVAKHIRRFVAYRVRNAKGYLKAAAEAC